MKNAHIAIAAAAALVVAGTSANATTLVYNTGDVISGTFGDDHIKKGTFTDTLAFTLAEAGDFSASLTSTAKRLGKSGDLDFTSVTLTGAGDSHVFTIENNGSGDGLTDSAGFSGTLDAGSYLLTIKGRSFGNAELGGDTAVTAAVPESATWLSMLLGFGLIGTAIRRGRTKLIFA